ncbi:hypothetical protein PHMEG_00026658 [Phytophthora megakarya]|uniref:Uncharacterized protein n=1 Tax=Phytophthora megakarya TaxID=4795 RepID=A0A225V8R7_9STRA|nr:hypothetical protein PHMEG_00026658 [Phytophthora megakarya]
MRRECTTMCRHWSQRVRALKQDRIDGEDFLRQRDRDAESRHQARITELTDQITRLQAQLRDSETARQAAERRAEERVLDCRFERKADSEHPRRFPNKPKIIVMFNWMRLAAPLHHFAEGTAIPEGWLTNINVVALDGPRCECPERASTSGSRAGNRKPKASAARDVPVSKRPSLTPARDLRHRHDGPLRPRGYSPRNMLVYSPRNVPNARSLAEAGRALPAGMLWTDVREDVQHLLWSGMNFTSAMRWVSEGQGIHHLVPREAVCRMLAQVIHAGQLDEPPWCCFVPEGFYTSAEGTLRVRHANREPTPPWHPLGRCYIKVQRRKQSTRETEAIQAKLSESSDDEIQDPS